MVRSRPVCSGPHSPASSAKPQRRSRSWRTRAVAPFGGGPSTNSAAPAPAESPAAPPAADFNPAAA
eukprot:2853080-Alexandrium_andersonii.AAC.1